MTNHPNRGRATETVTLIRHRSGFANVPDGFRVILGDPAAIDEFTQVAETYWLPDGYMVAECVAGSLEIYDADGNHCEIIEHASGRPQLWGLSRRAPILKRAR